MDYLHVHADNPWYNYYAADATGVLNYFTGLLFAKRSVSVKYKIGLAHLEALYHQTNKLIYFDETKKMTLNSQTVKAKGEKNS